MARLSEENSDSGLSSPEDLIQASKAKVPLKPTTGNIPTPSPRKRTAASKGAILGLKDTAICDDGELSPVRVSASPVRSRVAATGRQQRSLKLAHNDSLLLAGAGSLLLKARDASDEDRRSLRESPKRKAKEGRVYVPDTEASDLETQSNVEEEYVIPGETSKKHLNAMLDLSPVSVMRRREDDDLVADLDKMSLQATKLQSPRKKHLEVVDLTGSPTKTKGALKSPTKKTLQFSRRRSSTSTPSDHETLGATLRFSPPLHKSPTRRPPVDATPPRPQTPPASPTKSRLASPTKRPPTLPAPPLTHHRPSLDAFWDQAEINTWTDTHSPKKILASPRKPRSYSLGSSDVGSPVYSPTASPRKTNAATSPSKKQAATAAKKAFDAQKQEKAESLFNAIDIRLARGEVTRLAESSGGVKIIWSKKLNSTAGRANWRREAIRRVDPSTKLLATVGYRHIASIELAEKVIDDDDRLNNVLAHEYCHLANFMISRVLDNPHGASFRSWASKATAAFYRSHGVEVTTKHDYAIKYKYLWVCNSADRSGPGADGGCGTEYARHSKSIDPARHTCGKCRGRLIQVRPKPRGKIGNGDEKSAGGTNASKATGTATEYQRFVKERFQTVRSDLPPGSPMKDVMREVGSRYRLSKQQKQKGDDIIETIEIVDDEETEEVVTGSSDAELRGGGCVDGVARVLDFMEISEAK